jgi:hypothetical protein
MRDTCRNVETSTNGNIRLESQNWRLASKIEPRIGVEMATSPRNWRFVRRIEHFVKSDYFLSPRPRIVVAHYPILYSQIRLIRDCNAFSEGQ